MRSPTRALPLLGSAVLLVGCRGDLIATAVLAKPGTTEVRYTDARGVALWSDWEGEWNGGKRSALPIAYDIEVFQGGAKVGSVSCNANDNSQSICGTSTTIFGKRSADCEVKLRCALPATKPGEVVLRVTGRITDPVNTKVVKKMNLNVRAS